MSRLTTPLRSFLIPALTLLVGACTGDRKETAESTPSTTESPAGDDLSGTNPNPIVAAGVTDGSGLLAPLTAADPPLDAADWVSIGAEVVDGETTTYNPPTPWNVPLTWSTEASKEAIAQELRRGYISNAANSNYNIRGGRANETSGTVQQVGAGAVGADPILNEVILAEDIATGAMTTDEILNQTITSEDIQDGQVMTVDIANLAVTNRKLSPNAVTTDKIRDGEVMNPDLATESVTTLPSTSPVPGNRNNPWLSLLSEGLGNVMYDSIGVNNRDRNEQQIQEVVSQPEPPRKPSHENHFRLTSGSPYSTFSIDVDNAGYSNVRGYLTRGQLPPPDEVRIEELVNYFKYDYPEPTDGSPFAFNSETTVCPWNRDHLLVRLALQGRELQKQQAQSSNLVFLIDVSGSMSDADKLPLLKESLKKLINELRPEDRVAIVVYAGAAGLVLESTSDKGKIRGAIDRLSSGGSTAGGAGIELAYKTARKNFMPDGVNRVILATDGDFNVGVSSEDGLVKLIEEKRKDGIFLSVLGFGTGNYQDKKMEQLADHGNGNYYYIDRLQEGERVLVDEMSGTLYAIAKDVKLQLKFNPEKVAAYRLIGYENRVLAARDFDDDTKDAGELGAGHQVTALYEVVPVGAVIGYEPDTTAGEDYKLEDELPDLFTTNDLLLARLRYKEPTDSVSKLIQHLVRDERKELEKAGESTRFAAAVAGWGMLLRGSDYRGRISYDDVVTWGKGASGSDGDGYRREFIGLVEKSKIYAQGNALSDTR